MSLKVLLILCAFVALAQCKSVIIGQTNTNFGVRQMEQRIVERNAIPFIKRKDELELNFPGQVIKGIAIRDQQNGLAEASISRGGLGFNYAVIKLKSERSEGYSFVIDIYG